MEDVRTKNEGGLRAIFSMGEYHYKRYDAIFQRLDAFAVHVIAGRTIAVMDYYATLKTFYINIKYMILQQDKFNSKLKDIEKDIAEWQKKIKASKREVYPNSLANKLLHFHDELIYSAQVAGLGIEVQIKKSRKKMLGEYFGG